MNKPEKLKQGDKVAIVSLSSGMLGEEFCSHNLEIGSRRLKEMGLVPVFMPHALKGIDYVKAHPEKRAEDLKTAFLEAQIKGIFCAIGGDDTYRTLPYLMEDRQFLDAVVNQPKIFSGFSDTTVNHLMFYQLGLQTYYGPAFIPDIGEIANEMLPYTKEAFQGFFQGKKWQEIHSSPVWYDEREDFSKKAMGTDRIRHREERGFELIQGEDGFTGELLGGCLESLYEMCLGGRHEDQVEVCQRYNIFPSKDQWQGKILFLETSEEQPEPSMVRSALELFKEKGIFNAINGVLVGKPQNEKFYEEYKQVFKKVIGNPKLPVLYNVNFGHALPRTVLPYGAKVEVRAKEQRIVLSA